MAFLAERAGGQLPPEARSGQRMRADRQRSEALACCREDGVTDRRRNRRHAGLADTTRRGIARYDVDVELGRLIQAQHPAIVEVALLNTPAPERDVAPERGRQAVYDAALEL